MSDRPRQVLALRTIVTSARSALGKASDPADRERIRDRVHDLLADLEAQVIRDGADEEVLGTIERKRRELWE